MSKLIVKGGTEISGEISVCGSKNAALPILACSLLTNHTIKITNCPKIADVLNMLEILRTLGCEYEFIGDNLYINASKTNSHTMPHELSKALRSSIFMLGPILGRFKKACCVYPGGCEIGNRPIDLHLRGLRELSVDINEEEGIIQCDGKDMCGASVHLDYPSVGATENIMMAATGAKGMTEIINAAREPEIEDLQTFLREIGYNVYGAGTSTVVIDGRLPAFDEQNDRVIEHRIIPDRIVAGTLSCAAAITGGDLLMHGCIPAHMSSIVSKLRETGCQFDITDTEMRIIAPKRLREIKSVETQPHPGFPTDMQALIFAVCTVADGTSVITENVFENRYKHAPELVKMGASVVQRDRIAVIRGVSRLKGATVCAMDLRCGAALTIAGLAAEGITTVENAECIDRGYESIEKMLNSIGANIQRV